MGASTSKDSTSITRLPGNCNSATLTLVYIAPPSLSPQHPPPNPSLPTSSFSSPDSDPTPLITITGNMNSLTLTLTLITCPHMPLNRCTSRLSALSNSSLPSSSPRVKMGGGGDKPLRITGNCNAYKVHVVCYGRVPGRGHLVSVEGNMNDVKVKRGEGMGETGKERRWGVGEERDVEVLGCGCEGVRDELDDEEGGGEGPRAPETGEHRRGMGSVEGGHGEAPPAYEERRVEGGGVQRGGGNAGTNSNGETKTLLMSSISSLDGTERDEDELTDAAISRRSSLATVDAVRA